MIRDPRDLPFLSLLARVTPLLPAAALLLQGAWFSWWFAAAYLACVVWWLGPFVLMLHNVSHRPCFTRRWRFLNGYIDWVVGPLFGLTPWTYFAHHVGIHHPENNLGDDVSSTMRYQRDSLVDFLCYFGRFLVFSLVDVAAYLKKRGRVKLLRRAIAGECAWWAAALAAAAHNWRGAVVVFFVPLLVARFGMMSGNWAQHAFIDAASPGNNFRNSIACVDTLYNRRCFNDGYHIGHHLRPNRHWTEMPGDFIASREAYAREGAIVFRGLDYMAIWFLLMRKKYDTLARHVVDPGGRDMAALLRERARRIAV